MAAVVLGAELLLMVFVEPLVAQFKLPPTTWDFIDAVALTSIIAPSLYFLVFRKLHDSEERFRQTLATAPNAIVLVDGQGRITDWNLAAQQMFGYSREEAVGQQMHQLLPPQRYRDDAVRGFARFQETGEGPVVGKTTEIAALRRDGSEFPIELSISATKMRGRWHAIGIIHDITERRRAEELVSAQLAEIERARLDWKAVFDSISHPVFLHDNEFRVIRANRAYAEQAGKPFQEIIGQPYYTSFPKGDKPLPCCLRAIEKAEEEEEEEVAVGAAIYRSRSFAVRNEQGVYLYSVHILEDITERKHQQERTAALLELSISAETLDEKALLQRGLDTAQRLTGSRIGFLHFVSEDQNEIELVTWSTDTLAHYCHALFDRHYPVSKAGIWVNSVHLKQPLIINDYATAPGKKGYPEGHADVQRFISVPILEGELVRMIVGVGNAARDYDEHDVETVRLFGYDLYRIVQSKRAEGTLHESEERFHHLFENMSSAVAVYQPDAACETFIFKSANRALERIERVKREEVLGRSVEDAFPGVRAFGLLEVFRRVCRSGEAEHFPPAYYRDERISGWRDNYVYRLDSGEIVAVYDDVTERKEAEELQQQSQEQLSAALEDAIGAIAATLEQRDPYTAGHQRRVAQLASAIGEEMGLAREVIEGIHFGGLIHDLGKISVPAEILGKPGRLTDIEFGLIKVHAEAGYQIVKDIAFPWPVADMVRQHHERLDGSGYPQGLKGDQIILEARIMAVADVVEAMSANRPYRPGFGTDAALKEITQARGAQLDSLAVDACLRLIREKGFVFTK